MKILAQCDIPDELAQAFLQHLRDFDAAHPRCRFEIMTQTDATVPVREMVEMLQVEPRLNLIEVYEFAKAKRAQ